MSWLSLARMAGLGLGAALIAAILWLAFDRFEQKALADAARACEAAAASADRPLAGCSADIAARIAADRRTIVCEGALLPELRGETRFTARQACGPGTLRLIAQSDALTADVQALETELAEARGGAAAAVARAEARGRTEQARRDNAQQIIDAAPRGAGGRIACDAACLRRLAD